MAFSGSPTEQSALEYEGNLLQSLRRGLNSAARSQDRTNMHRDFDNELQWHKWMERETISRFDDCSICE